MPIGTAHHCPTASSSSRFLSRDERAQHENLKIPLAVITRTTARSCISIDRPGEISSFDACRSAWLDESCARTSNSAPRLLCPALWIQAASSRRFRPTGRDVLHLRGQHQRAVRRHLDWIADSVVGPTCLLRRTIQTPSTARRLPAGVTSERFLLFFWPVLCAIDRPRCLWSPLARLGQDEPLHLRPNQFQMFQMAATTRLHDSHDWNTRIRGVSGIVDWRTTSACGLSCSRVFPSLPIASRSNPASPRSVKRRQVIVIDFGGAGDGLNPSSVPRPGGEPMICRLSNDRGLLIRDTLHISLPQTMSKSILHVRIRFTGARFS